MAGLASGLSVYSSHLATAGLRAESLTPSACPPVGRRPDLLGSPGATWQPTRAASARGCTHVGMALGAAARQPAHRGGHSRPSLHGGCRGPRGWPGPFAEPQREWPCPTATARPWQKLKCFARLPESLHLASEHGSEGAGHLQRGLKAQQGTSQGLEL